MISSSNQDASQSQSRDIRLKLLAHPDRLLGIQSGRFAPPILVDIDPVDGDALGAIAQCYANLGEKDEEKASL